MPSDFILDPHIAKTVENKVRHLREELADLKLPSDDPQFLALLNDIESFVVRTEFELARFEDRILQMGGCRFSDCDDADEV